MNTEHDQTPVPDRDAHPVQQQQQQPQQSHPEGHAEEGHAGQGSESAMKQLRAWEQRRSTLSGGKRRQGPG